MPAVEFLGKFGATWGDRERVIANVEALYRQSILISREFPTAAYKRVSRDPNATVCRGASGR